jgi:hypothetical protein
MPSTLAGWGATLKPAWPVWGSRTNLAGLVEADTFSPFFLLVSLLFVAPSIFQHLLDAETC